MKNLTHISRKLWPMLFSALKSLLKCNSRCLDALFPPFWGDATSFGWLFCQLCQATKQVGGPFLNNSGSSTCSVFFLFERSYNEIANCLYGISINKLSVPFKIGHYDTRKITISSPLHYYLTHISRKLWRMLFLCIEITFKMQCT